MKNAILLHGTGCTPSSYWFPSIRKFLESNGYSVWAPQLPDADVPNLKKWLPFVLENVKFNSDTTILSHSVGGPLTLSVLESISTRIKKAILVAGYARLKGDDPKPEPILQTKYNWSKIKANAEQIFFINSDNDPWGCDHHEGQFMFDQLGGTLVVRHGEGHMGSDKYKQPYKKFPLLEKILELD